MPHEQEAWHESRNPVGLGNDMSPPPRAARSEDALNALSVCRACGRPTTGAKRKEKKAKDERREGMEEERKGLQDKAVVNCGDGLEQNANS